MFSKIFLNLITNSRRLRRINDKMLSYALRVRGYNNFRSDEETGEKFFIQRILKEINPEICVDVGANIGRYSMSILSSCKTSKVYAFEPLPQAFKDLLLIKNKYSDRIVCINKGVGSKNDKLTINFNEEALSHASFSEEVNNVPYVENKETIQVDVVSLDYFFLYENKVKKIDFIKIDTEGFEYEVLLGSKEVIRKFKPKLIQIEFNWHQLFKVQSIFSFSEILHNYHIYQLLPQRMVLRDPKDSMSNIYAYSNFVFLRKDIKFNERKSKITL